MTTVPLSQLPIWDRPAVCAEIVKVQSRNLGRIRRGACDDSTLPLFKCPSLYPESKFTRQAYQCVCGGVLFLITPKCLNIQATVTLEPLSMSLCQILWKFLPGDLAHQAATASSALTGNSVSIPSSNLAPPTSNPIRFRPPFSGLQRSLSLSATTCFRRRHLEHKVQRAVSTLHPLRHICPQPHCAEHRLQRVRSPKMHPVFRREVVEAHERVPVPNHRLSGIDATSALRSTTYSSRSLSHSDRVGAADISRNLRLASE